MVEGIGILGMLFLGLVLGYVQGVEKERKRICEAFRHEREYSDSDFDNVLEENRKRKERWKADEYWVKFNKKNEKFKNKLKNKKNQSIKDAKDTDWKK